MGADPAEVSDLATRNATVTLDVLQHHLLLLQRLEATLTHVGRGLSQSTIDGRADMVDAHKRASATLSVALCLAARYNFRSG